MKILDHSSLSNDQVELLSQFANAVYQDTVNVAGWQTITPSLSEYGLSNDLILGNSFANADLLNVFNGEGDANAVLAKQGDIHILAFRGTDSFRDSLDWVGTFDHFELFFPLFDALSEYSLENPISQLWVTGHSLGGAMVEHYLDTYEGTFISAVSFASPRASLDDSDTRLLNIGHENDIVYSISGLRQDNANSTTNIYTVIGEEHGSGLAKEHSMTEYIYTTSRIFESAYYDQMTRDSLVIIDRTDNSEEIYNTIPSLSNPDAFILGEDDDDDIIRSGRGDDVLEGLGGNDYLVGDNSSLFSGNDTLDGGLGDDTLDGGEGEEDLAVYSDAVANYDFEISDDGETVTISHVRGTQTDGTDTLTNVEFGQFSDQRVQLLGNTLSFVNDFVVGTTQDTEIVFELTREGDTSFPVTIFVDGEVTTGNAVFNDFNYTLEAGESPNLIITASVSEVFGDVAFPFEISIEEISIEDNNPLSGLILIEDNDAQGLLIGDQVDDRGGRTFGDPHLITFDNLAYDFQASGDFLLTRATDGAEYEVQTRFVQISSAVSVTEAMATSVDGNTISLEANGSEGTLLVNGETTTISNGNSVTVGSGSISRTGQTYNIDHGNGDSTSIDVFSSFINVTSSPSLTRTRGTIEGLLGNANGNPVDDFQLANGTVLQTPLSPEILYGDYAASWLVDESTSLLPGVSEEYVAPSRIITVDSLPETLRQIAEAAVDAVGITNPVLRDAAILDFALTGNEEFIEAAELTNNVFNPIVGTVAVDPVNDPVIILTSDRLELDEEDASARTATLTVARGSSEGDLTVNYSIQGVGTDPAEADDFLDGVVTGEVVIEDGADLATFDIQIVDDLLVEETETFDVSISLEDEQASSFEILVSSLRFSIKSADEDGETAPNIIEGTAGRDSLTGTEQSDRITGLQSRDTITGGGGDDIFSYTGLVDAGDMITDLEVGSDKIDLVGVLDSVGFAGIDPIAEGYVGFRASRGVDTILTIDPDGATGTGRARSFILVQGVTSAELNNSDNFIFS